MSTTREDKYAVSAKKPGGVLKPETESTVEPLPQTKNLDIDSNPLDPQSSDDRENSPELKDDTDENSLSDNTPNPYAPTRKSMESFNKEYLANKIKQNKDAKVPFSRHARQSNQTEVETTQHNTNQLEQKEQFRPSNIPLVKDLLEDKDGEPNEIKNLYSTTFSTDEFYRYKLEQLSKTNAKHAIQFVALDYDNAEQSKVALENALQKILDFIKLNPQLQFLSAKSKPIASQTSTLQGTARRRTVIPVDYDNPLKSEQLLRQALAEVNLALQAAMVPALNTAIAEINDLPQVAKTHFEVQEIKRGELHSHSDAFFLETYQNILDLSAKHGQWHQCLKIATQVQEFFPESYSANYFRAVAELHVVTFENLERAIQYFTYAIENFNSPHFTEFYRAFYERGCTYAMLGDASDNAALREDSYNRAKEDFLEIFSQENDPYNARALLAYANLVEETSHDEQEIIESWLLVTQRIQHPHAWSSLAKAYHRTCQFANGIEAISQAIILDSSNALYFKLRHLLRFALRNTQNQTNTSLDTNVPSESTAAMPAERADVDDDLIRDAVERAILDTSIRDYAQTVSINEKSIYELILKDPTASDFTYAVCHFMLNDDDKAKQYLQKYFVSKQTQLEFKEATMVSESSILLGQNDWIIVAAHTLNKMLQLKTKNYSDTHVQFVLPIDSNPQLTHYLALYYNQCALIAVANNQYEEAGDWWAQAISLSPRSAIFYVNRSDLFAKSNMERSTQDLEMANQLRPSDPLTDFYRFTSRFRGTNCKTETDPIILDIVSALIAFNTNELNRLLDQCLETQNIESVKKALHYANLLQDDVLIDIVECYLLKAEIDKVSIAEDSHLASNQVFHRDLHSAQLILNKYLKFPEKYHKPLKTIMSHARQTKNLVLFKLISSHYKEQKEAMVPEIRDTLKVSIVKNTLSPPALKFFNAVMRNDIEAIKTIVANPLGFAINVTDSRGRNALHYAAINKNFAMIAILIEHGCWMIVIDKEHQSPLHSLANNYVQPDSTHPLIQAIYQHETSETVKMTAIKQALVDNNTIHSLDKYGRSALHYAVIRNDFFTVSLLLSLGASLEVRDIYQYRPADYAEYYGFTEIHLNLILRQKQWFDAAKVRAITPPYPECMLSMTPQPNHAPEDEKSSTHAESTAQAFEKNESWNEALPFDYSEIFLEEHEATNSETTIEAKAICTDAVFDPRIVAGTTENLLVNTMRALEIILAAQELRQKIGLNIPLEAIQAALDFRPMQKIHHEHLQWVGEAFLNWALSVYLYDRFPKESSEQLRERLNRYNGKSSLYTRGKARGIHRYILTENSYNAWHPAGFANGEHQSGGLDIEMGGNALKALIGAAFLSDDEEGFSLAKAMMAWFKLPSDFTLGAELRMGKTQDSDGPLPPLQPSSTEEKELERNISYRRSRILIEMERLKGARLTLISEIREILKQCSKVKECIDQCVAHITTFKLQLKHLEQHKLIAENELRSAAQKQTIDLQKFLDSLPNQYKILEENIAAWDRAQSSHKAKLSILMSNRCRLENEILSVDKLREDYEKQELLEAAQHKTINNNKNSSPFRAHRNPDQKYMIWQQELSRMEKRLRYVFNDKLLLARALTHPSYVYAECPDNSVFLFLGEAVIKFMLTLRLH
ncbi:MAG: ankyrin repeat domain-containing protein, partial [Gammaproteobacteria bacterium]